MKSFLWRHKFLIVIWVIVLTIGGYIVLTVLDTSQDGEENPYTISASEQAANDAKTAETLKNQPKQVKIGEAARDQDLEFTVKGTRCDGERTIGTNTYAHAEAEAQFCRLSVSVKNVGSAPASLPLSQQKAFVTTEDARTAVTDATQYAQADQTKSYWYDQIAPGSTVTGDLVFDLNGNEEMLLAELHAAENSPGVKVNL